ncbi:Dynein heavy chain 3, axonemal [Frankliniella fusca]|uniref:Dynein heavy chain 3, axonemal n=1 Tax=Frankliniella fusca TaxID=407009 RepID=A0AAE1HBG5_9NEOP|nr:Dynein heavy chain 3, axonemal [Frankliniella fusca]
MSFSLPELASRLSSEPVALRRRFDGTRSTSPLFYKDGAFYVLHERGDGDPGGAVARDWEALEAIVRIVLGRTMDDLVQRFAQIFVKEPAPAVVVPVPLPLPAPPATLALVRAQHHPPAADENRGAVVKSEMILASQKTAASAVGAAGAAGKSRSHPGAGAPRARTSRAGQCRCRESREQLERLSMPWASSGDSSDVHPASAPAPAPAPAPASKHGDKDRDRDSSVAAVPSRYSSLADRPPWKHSFRAPSSVRTPGWGPPGRTPSVSPLASPRQRSVQKKGAPATAELADGAGAHESARGDAPAPSDARGDAPAPVHVKIKAVKSSASRTQQSSVQVLYEVPPRMAAAAAPASPRQCVQRRKPGGEGEGEDEAKTPQAEAGDALGHGQGHGQGQGQKSPRPRRAALPPVPAPVLSEAETQTLTVPGPETGPGPGPGPGPCCRSVMNQVQELRRLITSLQQNLSQLGEEARQRDMQADMCRRGVEFWQKRYEDLRNEYVRCQRSQSSQQ